MTVWSKIPKVAKLTVQGSLALGTLLGAACSSSDDTPVPTAEQIRTNFVLTRQRDDLHVFVEAVSDPSSPEYRQYLSVETIAKTYGASDEVIAAALAFLGDRGEGFDVDITRTVLRGYLTPGRCQRI